jgi:hypothetical protein
MDKLQKYLDYALPENIVIPKKMGMLVECAKFNYLYGDPNMFLSLDHDQKEYILPIYYDYECSPLIKIYLINLHPFPYHKFYIRTLYRETDYTSSGKGEVHPLHLKKSALYKYKYDEIPDMEDLIGFDESEEFEETYFSENEEKTYILEKESLDEETPTKTYFSDTD